MASDEVENEDGMDVETEEAGPSSNRRKRDPSEKRRVYLPGAAPLADDEELVHDPSAYVMLHEAQTGAPCLSFDIVPDGDGNNRTGFPLSAYFVAGTQSERANGNSIIVMKASQLRKTLKNEDDDDSSSESESDDDDDEEGNETHDKNPVMEFELIKHHGCVNRIRATVHNDKVLAGVWSEMGKVTIVDISPQLQALADPTILDPAERKKKKKGVGEPIRPLYVFSGHRDEGYGIDWSNVSPGYLATGDCQKNLHIWTPSETGWSVGKPLLGHSQSVEDIQWSPNEATVLATCSVDKSLKIWDTREEPSSACKLTIENAHSSDVNVISWNKREPLVASGGDEGTIKIWDLRQFKSGSEVAILKHHSDSITSVEWCPQESSVFASSGADHQIALWDLAVERDESEPVEAELKNLPPQLLFIHQGQIDIKELHWHPQIPGMVISTANSGFNFFKTISV
ncbi:Glutamate-rich WD repeat-containing protein [Nesidiocoris tenuis]|uniref:Glutamate-rich WD repeat-containing protein 1 n=3 Tax=Nesidiocoris tenuis TaxID=355587 RepID=A0ABN7B3F2_9HEMI|nr:Glutamate-rich WD repeat-containing protein [Nesidiocoris tenuis]